MRGLWNTLRHIGRAVVEAHRLFDPRYQYQAGKYLIRITLEGLLRYVNPFAIIEFVGAVLGILPPKKLRLKVKILRNLDGNPVATQANAGAAVAEASRIFLDQANVELLPVGSGQLINIMPNPAPEYVLRTPCEASGAFTDFGGSGIWFRDNEQPRSGVLGIGAPITAFVVREVQGSEEGCSPSILGDWVVVEGGGLDILAHEIGHACGLWHQDGRNNLMRVPDSGPVMTRLQRAQFRGSPHVTFL